MQHSLIFSCGSKAIYQNATVNYSIKSEWTFSFSLLPSIVDYILISFLVHSHDVQCFEEPSCACAWTWPTPTLCGFHANWSDMESPFWCHTWRWWWSSVCRLFCLKWLWGNFLDKVQHMAGKRRRSSKELRSLVASDHGWEPFGWQLRCHSPYSTSDKCRSARCHSSNVLQLFNRTSTSLDMKKCQWVDKRVSRKPSSDPFGITHWALVSWPLGLSSCGSSSWCGEFNPSF